MAKQKTKEQIQTHCKSALAAIEKLLNGYIDSEDPSIKTKADKLSYWLEDYVKFLNYEPKFKPTSLRRYKRGEIVKVHLGYNIGSEEGGLHYCVVMDKANSIHSSTITVVPLTSVKSTTNIEKLHPGSVYLGNSIYTAMSAKFTSLKKITLDELDKANTQCEKLLELDQKNQTAECKSTETEQFINSETKRMQAEVTRLTDQVTLITKIKNEIEKMKIGSIALVSQITTVSKIRIYDPKRNDDVLANIRLSNENLDLIDSEIQKLFLK